MSKPNWGMIAALAGVGVLIWSWFVWVYPSWSAFVGNSSSPSSSASSNPSSSPAAANAPSSSATANAPLAPSTPRADIAVLHYSFCPGPNNQGQVKLQLSVTNVGDVPVNASIGNIRLLIPGTVMPPGWQPKDKTANWSTASLDGKSYVAIPANGNGAYEWYSGTRTWASHWPASMLAPRAVASGSGSNQADVTFYTPASDPQVVPFGVALVTDDGSVIGVSQTPWGPEDPEPATF